MSETTLLEKLRELGDAREKVARSLADLSTRATFLDGQIALVVELLGGPEKVKALLEETPPAE